METIYISPNQVLSKKAVVGTVGFFDGVHRGHRFLIDQLKAVAATKQLATAVITFPVHPRKVLSPDFNPELLNDFEEKLRQLAPTGVDYCYVVNFTKDLSQLTARQFIHQVLHQQLHLDSLLVGYDHRFGKDRTEGIEAYIRHGREVGMDVREAESLMIDERHVSSTRIRSSLSEGNVEEAHRLLSYPYVLEGTVVAGNRIGRTIGFPTANIELNDLEKKIPAVGIYAVWVHCGERNYKGMLYIGSRPSIAGANELRIEVNLVDFSGDLYGQTLRIELIKQLRGDKKFDSLEALSRQLEADRRATLEVL